MTNQENNHRPQYRTERIGSKLLEILSHIIGITMQFAYDAGIHILKAPTRNHGIVTRNQETREHSQKSHPLPGCTIGKLGVGASCIGSTMATDDKLRNHTRDAEQKHASDVHQDKGCATFLTSHIREAPYVTQTYGTTSGSKNHSQLTTKTTSI